MPFEEAIFSNGEKLTICPDEHNTDANNVCIGCCEGCRVSGPLLVEHICFVKGACRLKVI